MASAQTPSRTPPQIYRGADAWVHGLAGRWRRRGACFRELKHWAEAAEASASYWAKLDETALSEALRTLRAQCRRQGREGRSERMIELLAALREIADRQLGLRPYPVQLMCALSLERGYLAEMATGEGKTLCVGLAAVLKVFGGCSCHVITVNEYLVSRDARRLQAFYRFCGVSVGAVLDDMGPEEKRKAYACDVTYTTSRQVLADFLRDRLVGRGREHPTLTLVDRWRGRPVARPVVEGGLPCALIDEADSVLIDEAVTPLIISHRRENRALQDAAQWGAEIARELEDGIDYRIDERYGEIHLTRKGRVHLEAWEERFSGVWRSWERREELVRTALVAKTFYHRGKQYLVRKGKVVIVDEFTGRPMPDRTWRQGLHQAVEAKEGLEITAPSETAARMSFQRFFRLYGQLAGTTGTAREAASEFWQNYHLPVMRIPSNVSSQRREWPLRCFASEEAKWEAVAEAVEAVHTTGRPILVGTRNVGASERLAERLLHRGLACQVLNASRLAEEALVIAKAGEKGRITIATNMAGRGTDIVPDPEVVPLGGLHVIVTEPHESQRIDRQLYGRAGRQGDPGTSQLFASAEDEVIRKYGAPWRRLGVSLTTLRWAQRRAEREAAKKRQQVQRMDDWLDRALTFGA